MKSFTYPPAGFVIPTQLAPRRLPQQQRSRLQWQLILDTTLELLDEVGATRINTNLIAERAGIEVASVYMYFPNKESIFCAILVGWLEHLRNHMSERAALQHQEKASPKVFLTQYLASTQTLPEMATCYRHLDHLFTIEPVLDQISQEHARFMVDHLVDIIKAWGSCWDAALLQRYTLFFFETLDGFVRLKYNASAENQAEMDTWIIATLTHMLEATLQP